MKKPVLLLTFTLTAAFCALTAVAQDSSHLPNNQKPDTVVKYTKSMGNFHLHVTEVYHKGYKIVTFNDGKRTWSDKIPVRGSQLAHK